jgi:hypothetical protein
VSVLIDLQPAVSLERQGTLSDLPMRKGERSILRRSLASANHAPLVIGSHQKRAYGDPDDSGRRLL